VGGLNWGTIEAMTPSGWYVLLASSLGLIVFVFIGYPLAVVILSRLFPRPIIRGSMTPRVTVLLPVRNGGPWIADKIRSILALSYPPDLLQIIVVSDGSTDETAEIVRSFELQNLILDEVSERGKAAAINRGLDLADGEVIFLTDVRQSLDPLCLQRMASRLCDSEIGVVSGELMIGNSAHDEGNALGLYWRYEKAIRKAQSAVGSATGATGAIYLIRRELAVPLPPQCLDDDVFLPLQAAFQGKRIVLEEGAWAYDEPTRIDQEFRRKVRTLAGIYQLLRLEPRLWLPGSGIWLNFWCHKMGRLATPFAFIGVVVSSIALVPDPLAIGLLACQAGCYGLALLDPLIPGGFPVKPLSSTLRAFATMQIAALAACSIAVRPASSFWSNVHTAPAQEAAATKR
jgi:cellulose synthase/poly-beta-1,6-N-acetylglucosamine synthase-like glycosyltransferase